MQASGWFEPVFRDWVLANLPMAQTEAINRGAGGAGCKTPTAARYPAKLLSAIRAPESAHDE